MKLLSVFTGIGGLELAAEMAGIKTVAFCEQDVFCQSILKKHWPHVPIFDDIRNIRGDQFGKIDIICGGFPCQDVSQAGKRAGFSNSNGTTTRSGLWGQMGRIVREIKPRWVVAENVRGLLSIPSPDRRGGGGFGIILTDLARLGYSVGWCVYGASDIGATHQRKRVFVIAHANGIGRYCMAEKQENGCSHKHIKGDIAWGYKTGLLPFDYKREFSSPSSGIIRNDDGIPGALDRLRALGNAVVPHQAYPIFQAIKEVDDSDMGTDSES